MSADHAGRKTTVRRAGEQPAKDWASADFAQLRPRIYALVQDLMRGVLAAVVTASPAEIGELIRSAGQSRGKEGALLRFDRAARAVQGAPAASSAVFEDRTPISPGREAPPGAEERASALKRNAAKRSLNRQGIKRTSDSIDDGDSRQTAVGLHDPFDITSPGELLASSDAQPAPAETQAKNSTSLDRSPADDAPAAPAEEQGKSDESLSNLLDDVPKRAPTPTPVVALDSDAASERRPRVVLREGERLLSATGSGVVIRRARR